MIAPPLLDISAARVFFDGIFSSPRVAHPEGVAIHRDGSVWCGTETGDLVRIAADGSKAEHMGGTDAFLLGLAFDGGGSVFACDLKHARILRYDASSRRMEKFASSGILVPNYPVVDDARGFLYVSDSRGNGNPGPGIFRFDLQTGEGGIWCDEPMEFANGMAMALDGNGLYVVQSDVPCVSFVPILPNGAAGPVALVTRAVEVVPDGLAFAPDGTLYISCYEPSRIYRMKPAVGDVELLIEDRKATIIAHPTNVAWKGGKLYTANLGRWHITEIDLATV